MNAIKSLPDISFIGNKDIDQVRQEMVADYESFISEATGQTVTLERSSVHRMELYAAAAQIYQAMQYIDRQGKQSILKYSYSDFLDNLAIFKGVTRNPATPATTTLRFTLSAVRDTATGIPQGTRVSTAGATYFATDVYAEIPAGSTAVDVPATCTVAGTDGNGFAAGELATIVDPIPYVASVTNTTATEGGAEIESDDDLAERVFLAPGAYSTAGPEDGYLYHAKAYSAAIGDVVATSNQAAGTVDIVFIMADGSTPGEEMIEGLEGYLQGKTIRPMTDLVRVAAPQEVTYTINLTYYINRSDSAKAVTIQAAVAQAVADYQTWQRAIGRDINPSQLVRMVMDAGAKRVTVTAPTYTAVDATKVSALQGDAVISYGGLEDD
ncbi:baseplate J/gp47 family protein [Flavonifractor sp. An100]|uniref:baseplate J/gp47 family protein n=1 Tax=Flavonifractor sp. An100 TaxID=1965538 RepID=UPI001FA8CF1B|nr:baseplate J/gp47 family protein [Flavonifractor sp. An100]